MQCVVRRSFLQHQKGDGGAATEKTILGLPLCVGICGTLIGYNTVRKEQVAASLFLRTLQEKAVLANRSPRDKVSVPQDYERVLAALIRILPPD
jgi:hypothetical protein